MTGGDFSVAVVAVADFFAAAFFLAGDFFAAAFFLAGDFFVLPLATIGGWRSCRRPDHLHLTPPAPFS
jgi:hypothetical protein